jgi:3-phosphoglycerate kinase
MHVLRLADIDWVSVQIAAASAIPDGWMGLDVGPDSIKTYYNALDTAKTVIWNGPMGVFEFEKFAGGTEVIMSFAFEFFFPP